MTKGNAFDLTTTPDSQMLDVNDLMATLGCGRTAIWRKVKRGMLPPPLDRIGYGGRMIWTAGLIKKWQELRVEQAIKENSKMITRGRSVFG